jgi:hypothetical protein
MEERTAKLMKPLRVFRLGGAARSWRYRHDRWPWSSQGLAKSWRHISLMLVGVAAAAISVSPASATMRIIADPGGAVIDYVERFEAARASGEPVIIDGACLSACTLAVGLLPRGQDGRGDAA